jgi:hypothetical protein
LLFINHVRKTSQPSATHAAAIALSLQRGHEHHAIHGAACVSHRNHQHGCHRQVDQQSGRERIRG